MLDLIRVLILNKTNKRCEVIMTWHRRDILQHSSEIESTACGTESDRADDGGRVPSERRPPSFPHQVGQGSRQVLVQTVRTRRRTCQHHRHVSRI